MKRKIKFIVELDFEIGDESNENLLKFNKKIESKFFDIVELARQDNAFAGDDIEAKKIHVYETNR